MQTIESSESPCYVPSLVFEHFAEQFLHSLPSDDESLPTRGRRPIHPATPPIVEGQAGPQIALPFHAVQDGIERARAQAIAVATKLVDHRLAEDRTFGGMMEDVEPDEPGIQVAIDHRLS